MDARRPDGSSEAFGQTVVFVNNRSAAVRCNRKTVESGGDSVSWRGGNLFMRAVYIREFGGIENLEVREVPEPSSPSSGELLVRTHAAGVNRADILQRKGLYPAPNGFPERIPGLEFAGEILDKSDDVTGFEVGDRVFGISAGGAQAELLLARASEVAKIPTNLDFAAAAAIPEAFITAHDALFSLGGLKSGENLLIHAVGSGVGLAALQLAKSCGASVFGTSRDAEKLKRAIGFGLDEPILTSGDSDFADQMSVRSLNADAVLDLVGAAYFPGNLRVLSSKGRLILVGLTSGAKAEFNMVLALQKRLTIIGTVLRSRTHDEKAAVTHLFEEEVIPLLREEIVKPNIDRILPVAEVREAHQVVESNLNFGKVVLEF